MLKEDVALTTIYFHIRILQNANKHWKLPKIRDFYALQTPGSHDDVIIHAGTPQF